MKLIRTFILAIFALAILAPHGFAQQTTPETPACADPAVREQKSVFRRLTPAGRAEVMRLHVAELYKAPTTTPAQKRLLRELIPHITAELYAAPDAPRSPELAALLARADGLFKGTEAFARMGPAAAGLLKAKEQGFTAQVRLKIREGAECGCSGGSNYCGGCENGNTRPCRNDSLGCEYSSWGCGTLWSWPCDGKCQACVGGGEELQ
jgi:hypothetical protein